MLSLQATDISIVFSDSSNSCMASVSFNLECSRFNTQFESPSDQCQSCPLTRQPWTRCPVRRVIDVRVRFGNCHGDVSCLAVWAYVMATFPFFASNGMTPSIVSSCGLEPVGYYGLVNIVEIEPTSGSVHQRPFHNSRDMNLIGTAKRTVQFRPPEVPCGNF